MKKSVFTLVTLVVLGTSTSFGKTSSQPRENNNQPRQEVRSHSNNRDMGMRPEMEKPIPPHRHEFGGPKHECRVCHMTEHQIHEMEMSHHTPVKPMPQHKSPRH